MVIIVTYDENGGFWDHVPPPSGPGGATAGDRPRAFRRSSSHRSPSAASSTSTAYDTTSILKLITARFGLEPLPGVREKWAI